MIKVGDTVTVSSPGYMYSQYDTMAEKLGLPRWTRGGGHIYDEARDKVHFTVIAIDRHLTDSCMVCGIRSTKSKEEHVIGLEGLALVKRKDILDDKLFEF